MNDLRRYIIDERVRLHCELTEQTSDDFAVKLSDKFPELRNHVSGFTAYQTLMARKAYRLIAEEEFSFFHGKKEREPGRADIDMLVAQHCGETGQTFAVFESKVYTKFPWIYAQLNMGTYEMTRQMKHGADALIVQERNMYYGGSFVCAQEEKTYTDQFLDRVAEFRAIRAKHPQ